MEKLLYKGKYLNGRGFRGMKFSKNITGRTLNKPAGALTFSSNIRIIPDRLLPGKACFSLYRCRKVNTIVSKIENNTKNGEIWLRKILKHYNFLRHKNYLLKSVSDLRRSIILITPCKEAVSKVPISAIVSGVKQSIVLIITGLLWVATLAMTLKTTFDTATLQGLIRINLLRRRLIRINQNNSISNFFLTGKLFVKLKIIIFVNSKQDYKMNVNLYQYLNINL